MRSSHIDIIDETLQQGSPSQQHTAVSKSMNADEYRQSSQTKALKKKNNHNSTQRPSTGFNDMDEKYDLKIPRFLKVTNRIEDNDVDLVKSKLRRNMIFHMDFDPSLDNTEGRRYFAGVYIPNKHEEVFSLEEIDFKNIDPSMLPSNNLYDYIIDRGFGGSMGKGAGITTLRTGYNPAKQRQRFER